MASVFKNIVDHFAPQNLRVLGAVVEEKHCPRVLQVLGGVLLARHDVLHLGLVVAIVHIQIGDYLFVKARVGLGAVHDNRCRNDVLFTLDQFRNESRLTRVWLTDDHNLESTSAFAGFLRECVRVG